MKTQKLAARKRHAQVRGYVLSKLTEAAQDFNRARGRSRIRALERYTIALARFTDEVMSSGIAACRKP